MKNSWTNIEKSFRIAILVLLLITIALLSIFLNKDKNSNISGLLVGLPIFMAGILGFIGSIQAIKGFKEKKTLKMFFAIFINFGIVLLFIGLLISNILDIFKAFK